MTRRLRAFLFVGIVCALGLARAFAQPAPPGPPAEDAVRLDELRRLRDQLQVTGGLRGSDLLLILDEKILAEAVRQLVGLEIVLANGSALRVTSVDSELKTGAARFRIGLQARSSMTLNLQLLGRIGGGELENGVLRLPLRVTEVRLGNGLLSSALIKSFFGDWLKPATWNDELPGLELPTEVAETLRVPAGRFDVQGELPMEISTPGMQTPMKFVLASVLMLEKRAVLALRMEGAPPPGVQVSYGGPNDANAAALEAEIESLAAALTPAGDLRIRLGRQALGTLLSRLAAVQPRDFTLRLKPGRLRSEDVTAIVKITNYTDVESGEGFADIQGLGVDRIADGNIDLRMSGQGELDARLRGREYGIPYSLSPHVNFAIRDQTLPLRFSSDGSKLIFRTLPGTNFPIQLRLSTRVAGRDLGMNRTAVVQADRMLKDIEWPVFFGRAVSLPRRLEVDKGRNLLVTKTQPLSYTLGNLRASAAADALDIAADVKLSTP